MTSLETLKAQNPDLYADDEDDLPAPKRTNKDQAQADQGYNFEVDEDVADLDDMDKEDMQMSKAEEARIQNSLLFSIQGVGSIQEIAEKKVWAKSDYCQESIKDIIKHIKGDSPVNPIVKLTLGRWNFVGEHLIPLLTLHKQDKKLAFLALMLAVQLTELPCMSRD